MPLALSERFSDYRVGLYLLTGICGLIDATCFLALGGVFAELMTGNLLLMAFSAGAGDAPPDQLWVYLSALAPFILGALAAGILVTRPHRYNGRVLGYPVEFAFIVVATGLALLWTPQASGPLNEWLVLDKGELDPVGTDLWQRIIIVGILAFGMGIHNSLMSRHPVRDIPTNLMTLTLTRMCTEATARSTQRKRWPRQLLSVVVFLSGAFLGAWLLRFGIAVPLLVACALFAIALRPLMVGRNPDGDLSQVLNR